MKIATLCFAVKGDPANSVLLGYKKTGFGQGRITGFGGKLEANESAAEAAVREMREESGLDIALDDLQFAGEITFRFPARREWEHFVTLFVARRWQGIPEESDEMRPEWIAVGDIPYQQMWEDSRYFLPLVLDGHVVRATFIYNDDNQTVGRVKLDVIEKEDGRAMPLIL